MSELSKLELEGRLNGQREVLKLILAHLLRGPGGELRELLAERFELQNHQEDPGAVPSEAFAVEAAMARELKLLLDEALAQARKRETDRST